MSLDSYQGGLQYILSKRLTKPPNNLISSASEIDNNQITELPNRTNEKKILRQAMDASKMKNTQYIIESIGEKSNIRDRSRSSLQSNMLGV